MQIRAGRPAGFAHCRDDIAALDGVADADQVFGIVRVTCRIAVAVIDSGVNYLLPLIAEKLARNNDGRLVGFDFWDMDERPFDSHPSRSIFFPQRHGTRVARIIAREAPQIRLIPYRYPRPNMERMSDLVTAAAESGAQIINMSLGSSDDRDWMAFEEAALKHPELLFIVSAGNDGRDIDQRHLVIARYNQFKRRRSLVGLIRIRRVDGTFAETPAAVDDPAHQQRPVVR